MGPCRQLERQDNGLGNGAFGWGRLGAAALPRVVGEFFGVHLAEQGVPPCRDGGLARDAVRQPWFFLLHARQKPHVGVCSLGHGRGPCDRQGAGFA